MKQRMERRYGSEVLVRRNVASGRVPPLLLEFPFTYRCVRAGKDTRPDTDWTGHWRLRLLRIILRGHRE
jgi:hypothetical protein